MIVVKVRRLRDRRVVEVYLPDSEEEATVEAALEAAGVRVGATEILCVNDKVASPDSPLVEGDVITIIPQISGG